MHRLDRCLNSAGILLYIWDDIFTRFLSNSNKTESILDEVKIKKWLICASYNPQKTKISNHLHHLSKGLDNHIGYYDQVLFFFFFFKKTFIKNF